MCILGNSHLIKELSGSKITGHTIRVKFKLKHPILVLLLKNRDQRTYEGK